MDKNNLTYKEKSNYKDFLIILLFSLVCWGRLIFLNGIWWDDWAWIWHYFESSSISEHLLPAKNMGHQLSGYLGFALLNLLDIIPTRAIYIWRLLTFLIHTANAIVLYLIVKKLLNKEGVLSILPLYIAIFYIVAPVVDNLCLMTQINYELYVLSFLLSLFFTVSYLIKSKNRVLFYFLSIIFGATAMIGLESFLLLEFSRPALIAYLLWREKPKKWLTFRDTFIKWLPFLIIDIFLVISRLHFKSAGSYAGYNQITISLSSLFMMFYSFIYSLYYLFVQCWYKGALLITNSTLMVKLFSILAISLYFISLRFRDRININKKKQEKDNILKKTSFYLFVFGLLVIILGLLPYNVVAKYPSFGLDSRHATLAKIGISIFIPSLIFLLYYFKIITKKLLYVIFGLIIFIGAVTSNGVIDIYKNDWNQQRSFWWQFIWRVPDIKDKTYLLIDMPRKEEKYFGHWRGSYTFAAPLNLLYAKSREKSEINKNFAENVEINTIKDWIMKKEVDESEFLSYKGIQKYYPKNIVVASYKDTYLNLNNDITKSNQNNQVNITPLIQNSSPDQIIYEEKFIPFPFRWIIGPEPKKLTKKLSLFKKIERIIGGEGVQKDWLYYYQKAQVLVKKGEYQKVVNLYNEAEEFKLIQDLSYGLLPFIESYYRSGNTKKGSQLLWEWALSPRGNFEQAYSLYETLKSENVENEIIEEFIKSMNQIWGKGKLEEKLLNQR